MPSSVQLPSAEFGELFTIEPPTFDPWKRIKNIKRAMALDLPTLGDQFPHDRWATIVGAAPSVTKYIDEIRAPIFPLNGAHNWLVTNGVKPAYQIIFEDDITDITSILGGPPQDDVFYCLASQVNPIIFDQLKDYSLALWHYSEGEGFEEELAKLTSDIAISTHRLTLFTTIEVAKRLGYRNFKLYGIEGSVGANDKMYLEGYPTKNIEPILEIGAYDRPPADGPCNVVMFRTNVGLWHQASLFMQYCKANRDLRFRLFGDGALPFMHRGHFPDNYE